MMRWFRPDIPFATHYEDVIGGRLDRLPPARVAPSAARQFPKIRLSFDYVPLGSSGAPGDLVCMKEPATA